MSDPQDEQKLLTEIRDTQREHLAEYRIVSQRILATQERAVRRVRRAMLVLLPVMVVLLLLISFLPNGPAWCIINASRRASAIAAGEGEGPSALTESRYRYTAAQLDEIRDAEARFQGVETITGLVKAFGEPDEVVDNKVNTGSGDEYTKRKFVYHRRWKAIGVDVWEYFGGKYDLMILPKTATTQPHEAG